MFLKSKEKRIKKAAKNHYSGRFPLQKRQSFTQKSREFQEHLFSRTPPGGCYRPQKLNEIKQCKIKIVASKILTVRYPFYTFTNVLYCLVCIFYAISNTRTVKPTRQLLHWMERLTFYYRISSLVRSTK